MLRSITSATLRLRVFRLAIQLSLSKSLQEYDLDEKGTREMRTLLQTRGMVDTPERLCDAPFRRKPRMQQLEKTTRFSDGSFPVFYSSLDAQTAEAEIRYWFPFFSGKPTRQRTAYYSRFECDYDGLTKDLRPKAHQWPELVHDNDYQFCNELGAEAVQLGLDGLLAPSARRNGGTNLPVFTRRAISNPGDSVLMAVTYEPATGNVFTNVV